MIILSYGLGVDSTAILVRWIREPASRTFPLDQVTVINSNTGNEYTSTHTAVDTHVLPLLRKHGIRFVELARGGPDTADGYEILADTTAPTTLHSRGAWSVSDEYEVSGSVVQTAGGRKCAQRFKGEVIDAWIRDHLGSRPYGHAVGFAVGEEGRAIRDAGCYGGGAGRRPFYPLQEWGWTREDATEYLRHVFGVEWRKSCCRQCPFGASKASEPITAQRWAEEPEAAARILVDELRALSFNQFAGVYGGRETAGGIIQVKTAASLVSRYGLDRVRDLADAYLAATPWDVVRIRRLVKPAESNPSKTTAWRSLRILTTAPHRPQALEYLERLAHQQAAILSDDEHGIPRAWLRRPARGSLPEISEFFTIAPRGAVTKERPSFAQQWAATVLHPQEPLFTFDAA